MSKSTFCSASARAELQDVDLDLESALDAYGANDVDGLAAALLTELHGTGSGGEQGVVTATADVDAGVEVRAALTHDYLARLDDLTTEPLDAEAL
jgi:hypothetical protein